MHVNNEYIGLDKFCIASKHWALFEKTGEHLALCMCNGKREDMSSAKDPLTRWKDHKNALPRWASACKRVLLLQPSSAAAERVFFYSL